MTDIRKETDSLGEVDVAADKLWGAQTQRSLEHFSIGKDLIPREMITAYATLKKAAANANYAGKRLDDTRRNLIVQVCDEILAGQHHDSVPPACMDDGQRHPIQHERERSDLKPVLPTRRDAAW
jgi:fumarate hydratase class II